MKPLLIYIIYMNVFNTILPGILIAISDFIYVSSDNKTVAAFLFPLALITIIKTDSYLFTGKIGKIRLNFEGILKSLCILIGNILGLSILLLVDKSLCIDMIQYKLSLSYIDVFLKSVICGCLMYIAVSFTNDKKDFLLTILCVAGFIIGKCEHIIADIGYIFIAKDFNIDSLIFLIIVLIGNTVGAKFINFFIERTRYGT